MAGKTFDLSTIDPAAACEAGYELELRHPVTNEGLGVFITVYGKESAAFQGHVRAKADEALRKAAMQRKRGKDVEPPTVEKMEADAIDLLAACTKGWRNVVVAGETLTFSTAAARDLYAKSPWIREQVDEAIGDLGNFMTS